MKSVVLMALAIAAVPVADVPECECRAFGRMWQQGEEICLDGRRRVCGMDENVTSWLDTGRPCPQVGKNRQIVKMRLNLLSLPQRSLA